MTTSPPKNQAVSRQAKRARFATPEKKAPRGGASPLVLVVVLAVALALIGGTVFALTRTPVAGATDTGLEANLTGSQGLLVLAATHGHDPYPLALAEDGAVRFPLSTFDDHKAHFYTYMHDGRPIEFFILKSKDGVVRAAFNACDVCFPAKKGYHQEGDEMVCNNCGNRFASNLINEVRGGCNPSPLDRAVEGDSLIIQVEDILTGQSYF